MNVKTLICLLAIALPSLASESGTVAISATNPAQSVAKPTITPREISVHEIILISAAVGAYAGSGLPIPLGPKMQALGLKGMLSGAGKGALWGGFLASFFVWMNSRRFNDEESAIKTK